ncbi:MAG: glycosyltransferase [Cyanobacteria bacterium J06643_4]
MKVIAWPAFKTRYQNPYTWLLYSHLPKSTSVREFSPKRLISEQFDIFHLHWPVETIVRHPNLWVARARVLMFWLLLKFSKWRGTKIVWTIHDEKPHVVLHPKLAHWFTEQLVGHTDGCISLCEAGRAAVKRALPGLAETPDFVIKHGHYRGCYADEMGAEEARSHLSISPDATVLLYLGYISPYKNVPHLIEVFRKLPMSESPVVLLIAGKPDNDRLRVAVQDATGETENIQLHLRFIQDDELQLFFKAADLVVLPFEEILNSGSLLLSLSFNRPVLAPHLGAVPGWQQQVGKEWVRTYAGALTVETLTDAIQALPSAEAEVCLDELGWDAIAQQTLAAYESLTN